MLLAADIGNTNVTLGAFEGARLVRQWRLATDPGRTADEYGSEVLSFWERTFPGRRPEAFVYGSVVPKLDHVFETLSRKYLGLRPRAVGARSRLGIRIKVDKPSEVGADRVLNALAAHRLYGGPAIVLDFGTATTFDCVSARGDYLGGAILIGPRLAAEALARATAKLPEVEIVPTRRVIGKNTVECIQAGLYYGYLGMVRLVLEKSIKEMGRPRAKVIATGGLARLFAKDLGKVRMAEDLTLQGLRLAYETFS
ncbi:MAG TPA: type III pantothenate kinase [Elusimicrobiota bacterium]|nr:type III pantothenate kinase [Elusimicrobiota bacterium]